MAATYMKETPETGKIVEKIGEEGISVEDWLLEQIDILLKEENGVSVVDRTSFLVYAENTDNEYLASKIKSDDINWIELQAYLEELSERLSDGRPFLSFFDHEAISITHDAENIEQSREIYFEYENRRKNSVKLREIIAKGFPDGYVSNDEKISIDDMVSALTDGTKDIWGNSEKKIVDIIKKTSPETYGELKKVFDIGGVVGGVKIKDATVDSHSVSEDMVNLSSGMKQQ